ncbi:MAG TPA: phosphoribosyltransferase family protein [Candidatus Saccharimonadales bacterium]|nr:phosphoribosyltransferase family protein [Candidatus Saccharimonadales bacterium]
MYFKSRVDAGQKLAEQIVQRFQGKNCAVVGLSDGGVMVGAQIAMRLRCVLTMLMSEAINLPREEQAIAGIGQDGSFSYNAAYSPGELEDMLSEYHGYIEEEKMHKIQDMHRLVGRAGLIRRDLLKDHNVILVSDGLSSGFSLDVAAEFLKPIHVARLIVATPLASVQAVDRMHILADEIFCLSVVEDYISTDHYYDARDVPSHDLVVKTIEQIITHWQQ